MKIAKLWYGLVVALLVVMLLIPGNPVLADNPPVDVLVNFYQPPGAGEISLIQNLGGTVKEVYHIVPAIAATMPSNNLDTLRADPRVKSVEVDTTFSLSPTTPGPSSPSGGESPLSGQVLPWGVDRIDAELVHPSNNGTGIKVAILDSGIDLDHPDLAVSGNVTFVTGTTTGDDDNGHGTLVAGIVGALDNDIGVIGVAPEAALYAVKVLNYNGSGTMSNILSGIQWALDNNMQVINMSFGSAMQMPSTIKDALDNAYNAGIVIVAGAGDGGNAGGTGDNIWNPARYESVIAVGATDNTDARYTSSSTGYTLELVAPGVDIYSTAMGGGYGNITGTSASSPHAAGVAALLITDNVTNNVDVRYRLRNSAEDLGAAGWESQFGKGMVNASRAINFSEPPDQSMPTSTISLSGTPTSWGWWNTNVDVTLTAEDNPGGSGVSVIKYSLDSGGSWLTYSSNFTISSEGNNLLLVRAWDNAGNDEGPPAFKEVKIDKTLPLATTFQLFGTMGDNGWYKTNVNVAFDGHDNTGGSGIGSIEYSLNGGQTWQVYISTITVTTEGTNTVLARAYDKAGNLEAPPASREVKIDKTAPVTTISLNGTPGSNDWYLSDVSVSLSGADNISGVATIEYSLNGGGNWLTYSAPFVISSEGTNTVLARTRDNAGNLETPPASRDVKIDRTLPLPTTISLNGTMGNNDWYTSNVTATLTGADNISGVWTIEYSLNGGGDWLSYSAPFIISSEGTNTVLARTRDNAGNLETPPASRTFKLDKTPPALTETVVPSQIAKGKPGQMVSISYNGTAADSVSGLFSVNTVLIDEYGEYSQDLGSNLSGTVSVEQHANGNDQNGRTYTFRLTATDMAGNQASIDGVATVAR
ncbi:MAG: S8 family serine peptidase [Chloroflexi bacterium]|nr:S8 family serine peptidase [Chloroflexota bacterium]